MAGKNTLDPSDDAFAKFRFDGRDSPQFVGSLALEVRALRSDGGEAFRFTVLAEIVPEDELAFCAD